MFGGIILISNCFLFLVQCLLLESLGECASDKELEAEELEEILSKLRESVLSDVRQASVWNTLGMILIRTGRLMVHLLDSCYRTFKMKLCYA